MCPSLSTGFRVRCLLCALQAACPSSWLTFPGLLSFCPQHCLATSSPLLALDCSHPPETMLPHSHLCCCSPGLADVLQAWSCWGFCCICPVLPCLVTCLLLHCYTNILFLAELLSTKNVWCWSLVFPLDNASQFFSFAIFFKKWKEACLEAALRYTASFCVALSPFGCGFNAPFALYHVLNMKPFRMLLFWNISLAYSPMPKKFILIVNIQSWNLCSCPRTFELSCVPKQLAEM